MRAGGVGERATETIGGRVLVFGNHPTRSNRARFSGRYLWSIAVVVGVLSLVAACGGAEGGPAPDSAGTSPSEPVSGQTTAAAREGAGATGAGVKDSELATASYVVPTITCPSCSARVQASADEEPGVIETRIQGQDVSVTYDPQKTDPESIASAIREGGDTVKKVDG